MNDKEVGIIIGRLDTFEKNVNDRLDNQRENIGKLFETLDEHTDRIAKVETKTSGMSRLFIAIPAVIIVGLTVLGLFLKYFDN